MEMWMFAVLAMLQIAAIAAAVFAYMRAGRRGDGAEEWARLERRFSEQAEQLSRIQGRLAAQHESTDRHLQAEEARMERFRQQIDARIRELIAQGEAQRTQIDKRMGELARQAEAQRVQADAQRESLDKRMRDMQRENAEKLEQMRATVDEKLQKTLDERLTQSFSQVSQRLEAVYKGLGEMQSLAAGVGDLKRVLTNVKNRGTWGEVQLEALLEQMLAPAQYERGAQIKKNSAERVDFAIRMPGRGEDELLLPIDAKFPQEDYQRLLDAYDAGDPDSIEAAGKALSAAIRAQAKSISEKYIDPPRTTDFAIMYLPLEGLYAEALRQSGLVETLQRTCRVTLAGPTTVSALLTSLQMGFRSLAIEKRSAEVWRLLGAVKADFDRFAGMLEKTQKQLQTVSNTISLASGTSRAIARRLKNVEDLPEDEARAMLGIEPGEEDEGEED